MECTNSNWKFTNNHMVVITSNTGINMFNMRYYLQDNWNDIMEKNARLLILGGIHGGEDGALGEEVTQKMENETLFELSQLTKEMETEIKQLNVTIMYERVGQYLDKDTWQPKPDKLVEAIVKHQPTMLFLAFCYTSQSILNECLKSQGIYSMLILQRERRNITEGRFIFLDYQQRAALSEIARFIPSLVLLQGLFGTGKTLLLMEALRIKIAEHQKAKRKIRVIVTSDTKQAALIAFLKANFKFDDIAIEFYDCLKDVHIGDFQEIFGQVNTITDFNRSIRRLHKCQEENVQVILVVDEFHVKGKQDWTKFASKKNVDVLLAFHPRKESKVPFILPEPNDKKVVCCTLSTVYRNSPEVLKLCSFLSSHICVAKETSSTKRYKLLNPCEIESAKSLLPPGQTPLWIQLESDLIHPIAVFQYIKFKFLKHSNKVSFIIDDSHTHSEDVKMWLEANEYDQHTSSEFAQVAYSFEHSMRGLENEVFILLVIH